MADPKEKRGKIPIPTREPHKKTRTGIFDNLRQLPHPVEEFLNMPAEPRQTSLLPAGDTSAQTPSVASIPFAIENLVEAENPASSEGVSESASLSESVSLSGFERLTENKGPVNPERLTDSDAELPAFITNDLSPAKIEGPANNESPAKTEGPVKNNPIALQIAGLTKFEGLVINGEAKSEQSPADLAELSFSSRPDFSLLNSLPEVPGYAPAFHQITDYLHRQLTTAEQAIYNQLYRLTWGYERPRIIVGFPKLAERANVGESTARAAAKALEGKGLIKRHGVVFGLGHEQGIEWEVYPPSNLVKHLRGREERKQRSSKSTSPSKSKGPVEIEPMKDNVFLSKEHTQTHTGASVLSRFTLEECRGYANHLKQTGQGITNPGGYATKIFRSGEADAFIEAFLSPSPQLDISMCQDCSGSGFIYIDPSNRDKGVRPCKHDKLRTNR